jgi:zinc protease
MVEKYFGKIKSHPIPERNRVAEPSHEGIVQELTQTSERISLVNIEWNYAAPNHRVGDTRLYYPLIVLTQILGGNSTSRLYRHLVEDKKLAIEADSHMDTTSYDPRPISVSVTLAPGITTDAVKTEVKGLLDKLIKEGIREDELKAAQRDLQASLAFARDGNNSSVMAFVGLGAGFTVDDIEDWPNRIDAITVDQVNEAAKIVFGNHPVAIMTVFPKVNNHN